MATNGPRNVFFVLVYKQSVVSSLSLSIHPSFLQMFFLSFIHPVCHISLLSFLAAVSLSLPLSLFLSLFRSFFIVRVLCSVGAASICPAHTLCPSPKSIPSIALHEQGTRHLHILVWTVCIKGFPPPLSLFCATNHSGRMRHHFVIIAVSVNGFGQRAVDR